MMSKFHFLTTILAFLSAFCASAQEISIEGKVLNADNNQPVDGVNILLFKESDPSKIFIGDITNLKGKFILKELPPDDYILQATHIGYQAYQKKIDLDKDIALTIELQEQLIDLGEIVVSSLHQEKRVKQVSLPIEVMDNAEAEQLAGFSPSEILESQPGITMKDDGAWATSLNIRGMSEQRIVALADGNRIETATDIAGGLSMIDMSEIERVEIIKGASSSLYGTGAMGGVVNFISKKGKYSSQPYTKGIVQSAFQSVNEMYAQKFAVEGGNDRGHFRVSGKIRKAGDVKTPEGILPNSQFQDNQIALNTGIKTFENHQLNFQFQRFLAQDVGIPGGDPFPAPAKATYPEEKRNLISAEYKIQNLIPSLEELSLKYYHQYILRDVILEPNIVKQAGNMRVTPEKTLPTGKHNTDGLQLKTNWQFGENNQLIGGIDLWQRKLKTEREKYITREILDGTGTPVDTMNIVKGETPIPKSKFGSAGLFLQDEFFLFNNDLKITIGGRYDFIRVHNEKAVDPEYIIQNGTMIEDPPAQVITFPEKTVYNKSWSTNLGLLYSANDYLDFTLNAGRSFRSPSIEERYKYIDLGNMVRVGDPDLDPEEGYSFDAGFRVWKSKLNIKANGFLNTFSNLVVEQPGVYVKEYQTGTPDTLDALINENVDEARLYGFDMQFSYNPVKNWVLHGNAAFVRGRDTKNKDNLPLIPPLNGRFGVKHHFNHYGSIDLIAVLYDEQNKVADNEDITKGYALVDMRFESEPIHLGYGSLKVYGGVENLFDKAYRNHLSSNRGTLDLQPGRNFYLKVQLKF